MAVRRKAFTPLSLKALSDESLVRMLIQISRDRFDPAVKEKGTEEEAQNVVYELLVRLDKANKLHTKLLNGLGACGDCHRVLGGP